MSTPADPLPQPEPAKTVLLVEDEKATLRFYLSGLKGLLEFKLVTAENGVEALAALQLQPVDVVVTDLNMPVLDGYGLIAILAERYPSIPVIVLTCVEDPGLLDRAVELGALRVLSKPPKLRLLMEEIRNAAAIQPQGIVQGLMVSSLLQLLNWERKTATLTVRSKEGVGYLYVKDGELIHAACAQEEGILASFRILGWENTHVEFVGTCRVHGTMDLPIAELLLNIAMIRDQAQAQAQAQGLELEPELEPEQDPPLDLPPVNQTP